MADNLTKKQRSMTMSRIRRANTKPELMLRRLLHAEGLRYRTHCGHIAGCPDIVFTKVRVLVFVDGDFWHGWMFSKWRHKLGPYWKKKIDGNRSRDRRTHRRLRTAGWIVLRIWEHQIEANAAECARKVIATVEGAQRALAADAQRTHS
jgi:DNA mismatch endonuclease (patch repair protein)